jgi:DNA repair ATPase RecN
MNKSKTFDSYMKSKNIEQKPNKTHQILALFDEIESALKNGASIENLCRWVNEYHDITISKVYFNTILYRLRKSKGLTKNREKNVTNGKNTESDYQARYDDINQRYRATESLEEKYAILGGDPKKLDGHNRRKQREMCIELRMNIHNQYKPFIKL